MAAAGGAVSMTDTFTWVPLIEPQGQTNLRERKAQFGDAYKQRVADGINAVVQAWPISFVGSGAVIGPIKSFIEAHIGVSFYWTPPLGVQGYYSCSGHQLVPHGADVYTLTLTLQQEFKP